VRRPLDRQRARQLPDRALRQPVDGEFAEAIGGGERADVDDLAPATVGHQRENGLAEEERGAQVDRHDLVVGRGLDRDGGLASVHPGAIDQDVDPSEMGVYIAR